MRNIFFNPERDNLPPIVIDFLNYLITVKGKSFNTAEAYKIDLCLFFKFMKCYKETGEVPEDITNIKIYDIDINFISSIKLTDLYSFINYITIIRHNGPRARSRKTATIKSFYRYITNKLRLIGENPALELESPKISKRQPVYLTLEQSKLLLTSIDGTYKERDHAIITIFLNCGLRLSELVNINLSDIKGDTLIVTGKGNKQRVVYLNNACLKSIQAYLKLRLKIDTNSKAFFLSERKQRIGKRTVQYIVKKYLNKSGLGNKYSTHKLRHTAATLMYKYGKVDIRSLQEILGHESVSTTQIYTHVDDDELRRAINNNPLADL